MYTPILNNSKHFGNNRWFAFSPRLQRVVRLYSDLEYDNWALIEMNPLVETFCEQPIRIRKAINGQCIESIPDMWIRWVSGNETFIDIAAADVCLIIALNSWPEYLVQSC